MAGENGVKAEAGKVEAAEANVVGKKRKAEEVISPCFLRLKRYKWASQEDLYAAAYIYLNAQC